MRDDGRCCCSEVKADDGRGIPCQKIWPRVITFCAAIRSILTTILVGQAEEHFYGPILKVVETIWTGDVRRWTTDDDLTNGENLSVAYLIR